MPPKSSTGSRGNSRSKSPSKPSRPTSGPSRTSSNPAVDIPTLPKPGSGRTTRPPSPDRSNKPADFVDDPDRIGKGPRKSKSSASPTKQSPTKQSPTKSPPKQHAGTGRQSNPIDPEAEDEEKPQQGQGPNTSPGGRQPPRPTAESVSNSEDNEAINGPSYPGADDREVVADSNEDRGTGAAGSHSPPASTGRRTSSLQTASMRDSATDTDAGYLLEYHWGSLGPRWACGKWYRVIEYFLDGESWLRLWTLFCEEMLKGRDYVWKLPLWVRILQLLTTLWLFDTVICSPVRGNFCAHQRQMGRSRFSPMWEQFKHSPPETACLILSYSLIICGVTDIVVGMGMVLRRIHLHTPHQRRQAHQQANAAAGSTIQAGNIVLVAHTQAVNINGGLINTVSNYFSQTKNTICAWLEGFSMLVKLEFWKFLALVSIDAISLVAEPFLMLMITFGLPGWFTRLGCFHVLDVYKMVGLSLLAHLLKWLVRALRRLARKPRPQLPATGLHGEHYSDSWVLIMLTCCAAPPLSELLNWLLAFWPLAAAQAYVAGKNLGMREPGTNWRAELSNSVSRLAYTVTTKTVVKSLLPSTTGVKG